jgi:hypothetical protein
MTGMPFIEMQITEFISEIEGMPHDTTNERCLLRDFILYFKDLPKWEKQINDKNSSFLKILLLDDVFIIEKPSEGKDYEKLDEKELDLFSLKIYALLMCCGKSETKASILFDIVTGHKNKVDTD